MNVKKTKLHALNVITLSIIGLLSGCGTKHTVTENKQAEILPAEKFDLTHWQLNTPTDVDNDGVVDLITVKEIQNYQHPDFFYINDEDKRC